MNLTTPYPYQKAGVRLIHQRFDGVAILGDDMGLGKTFQALLYGWKYLPDDPPGPIVCVVPSTLKINWQREARRHLGLRVEVLSRQRCPDWKLPPGNPNQVYVINYEVLVPPNWDVRFPIPEDSWTSYLTGLKPRLVIGDEAQYLVNPQAARTRAFKHLARRSPRCLLLTGTPMMNSPADIWSLCHIILPKLFRSRFEFLCEYTHARKRPWGWEFKGARNLDKLHAILRNQCLVRRLKSEVLAELPQKTRTVVPMEVDLTEYHEAEADFVGWLARQDPEKARRAGNAEELTKLGYLLRLAGRSKVDPVIRWVRDRLDGSGEKLLLGANHKAVTHPIRDAFKRRAILVDGDVGDKEKQVRFDRFNSDPRVELLVGNMKAAGAGWSCRATSTSAIAEMPWNPGTCRQFEDRIHGLERGLPGVAANIYYLVAAGTIEDDVCRIVQTKQGWMNAVLDGEADELDELDVYEELKRQIKRRVARQKEVAVR